MRRKGVIGAPCNDRPDVFQFHHAKLIGRNHFLAGVLCDEPVLRRPNGDGAMVDAIPVGEIAMSLLLIIIVLVLLFGGGGGYYAHRSYGGAGLGGVLGLVLIVIVVIWLLNRASIGV